MFISQKLRHENIVEYLLYMWQVEDTVRAYDCDLSAMRREYLAHFDTADDDAREQLVDWYADIVRMVRSEGKAGGGHININAIVVKQLDELHAGLLASPKFPYYNTQYYKVLPYIVDLRRRGGDKVSEIETCLTALYGVMMLRLGQKDISPATLAATKEITTLLNMLADYYNKEKEDPKFWE